MDIIKPTSKSSDSPKQPNTGRRSFIWKMGTAMSAVLASVVPSMARPRVDQDTGLKDQVDQLSHQLGILEDANAIRALHQTYESYLDNGMYEEVAKMFTDDGQVVFNGGVFTGKKKGVRRLYCGHFRAGFTGKKIEPAPGFELDPAQLKDMVKVAPDRKSAQARFAYSLQVGAPIISDSPLVEMARLQGQGIMKWWEGGVHEVSYVKEGGSWKIKRLECRVIAKANYSPGRSYAKPIDVPAFSKTYPKDPTGPDKLISLCPTTCREPLGRTRGYM
jgi:hypothetical protein